MDGYLFSWESINGSTHEVKITPKTDFSGNYTRRNLGGAPMLRYEKSDGIIGSSLTLLAECQVNREFTNLYTSDPYEFGVELKRVGDAYPSWTGHIIPELYSEPDVAPPYDVTLTASDGLGELKTAEYTHSSDNLFDIFRTLLHSAYDEDLNIYSCISYTNSQQSSEGNFLANTSLDLSNRDGDSCYEVLKSVLATFNLTLMFRNGFSVRKDNRIMIYPAGWYIFNENDLMTETGSVDFYINKLTSKGTFSPTSFGSMNSGGWWPIDHLTTEMKASNKSVLISSETVLRDLVSDPNMKSGSTDIWTLTGNATYKKRGDKRGYFDMRRSATQSLMGTVKQTVSFGGETGADLALRFEVTGKNTVSSSTGTNAGFTKGHLIFTVKGTITDTSNRFYGQGPFYLAKSSLSDSYVWITLGAQDLEMEFDYCNPSSTPVELEAILPLSYDSVNGSGSPAAAQGIDTVEISVGPYGGKSSLQLFGLHLTLDSESEAVETLVRVTNNARSSHDDVEISIPFISVSESRSNLRFLVCGVPYNSASKAGIYSWGPDSLDFQTYLGLQYAKGFALPRFMKKGMLNTPAGVSLPPLMFRSDSEGAGYVLKAYDWDMLNDELSLSEMVEIPSGILSQGESGTWLLNDNLPMTLK